jgi:hypothetical protein
MKTRPNPKEIPQTEGHPEPFPKVNTIPSGWDLTDLLAQADGAVNSNPPAIQNETESWNSVNAL